MSSIEINIQTVNIGSEAAAHVLRELTRSGDPEALRDIGFTVPDEMPEEPASVRTVPSDEEIERLAAAAEETNHNFRARGIYLEAFGKEAKRSNMLRGFMITHKTEPKDRHAVESAESGVWDDANESLSRACGVCALRSNCRLEGDAEKWIAVHPYADRAPLKGQQSINEFLSKRKKDPTLHCDPKKQ